LELLLTTQGIQTLIVMGVTTEVCVQTTVREANDRGFHCIVVSDACASFFDDFHETSLRMIAAQGGIFGSVTDSATIIEALESVGSNRGTVPKEE
jgi:nicotinamidase-related amidase